MNFFMNGEKLRMFSPLCRTCMMKMARVRPSTVPNPPDRVRAAQDGDEDGEQEVVRAVAGPDGVHPGDDDERGDSRQKAGEQRRSSSGPSRC